LRRIAPPVQAAGIDELHAASKSARKIADLMHNLLWSPS
jgi:hypothetical protein